MAKIVTIDEFEQINVSGSVGKNAVNFKDDVMVVQALLKYSLRHLKVFRGENFPNPTGVIDRNTIGLIRKFQEYWNRKYKFIKLAIDGRIDPAYENVSGKGLRMTISTLNGKAFETWFLTGQKNENYINDVCKNFPQLNSVFSEGVGTLGLPLEPSALGIGTLNLALE